MIMSTCLKRVFLTAFVLFSGFITTAQAMDFSVHGYYRVRFEYSHDLDLQRPNAGIVNATGQNDNNRFGSIFFGQQRFRLNPHVKLNDNIAFHAQMDFLDNLLFGQSSVRGLTIHNPVTGSFTLPDANAPFGVTGSSGGDVLEGGGGNFNFRRLWVDIFTPAGQLRIGRQPSQFGLGIFSNDGDSLEGDFGDTYDRILYLAGLPLGKDGTVNFGVVYDFAYEAQVDPSIFGLDSSVDSVFNDTMQGGLLLMYKKTNFEIAFFGGVRFRDGNDNEPTTTALYLDDCTQDDSRPDEYKCTDTNGDGVIDSNDNTDITNFDRDNDGKTNDLIELPAGKDGDTLIYIADVYAKFNFAKYYTLKAEGVFIGGKIATGIAIDAIALDDPTQEAQSLTNPLTAPIELPLNGTQNDLQAWLAAVEFDAQWPWGGEFHVQSGYASGDDKPLSSKITQIGFRPDYDIALILFDQPIGTSPAIVIGNVIEQGHRPVSPNYINNAAYLTMEYKHEFDVKSGIPWADDFKVGLKGITAFAPNRNLDIDFTEVTGQAGLPYVYNDNRWYGFEVDASVEATFWQRLKWKSVAGVFVPGPLYDIKNDNGSVDVTNIIATIVPDKANIAFAAKTTLYFEF